MQLHRKILTIRNIGAMKTKMVIWGSNESDDKYLLGLELIHEENKVKIYAFPASSVTEVFYNQMMNLWRNGGPVSFPENHTEIIRDLSMTEDILPKEFKVERADLVNRAKTEWHFVVLSSKLREAYNSELQSFKDKVEQLGSFDDGLWEELKGFWDKVQGQVREKNLFKEHADELRENTNQLFGKLKGLRKSLNDEFSKVSKDHATVFYDKLKDIEKRINEGLGLHPIFNELKELQRSFNQTEFTRSDRSSVWKKLDGTFKLIKEKKFGTTAKDSNSVDRVNRRYNGLMSAIKKMQNSINRDKKDIEFQNNRIETTEGQLEMQIRQAKLAMIQERIKSKEEKLNEMLKTKDSVEKKLEQEKKKQAQKEEKASAAAKSDASKQEKIIDEKVVQTKPAETKAEDNKPAETNAAGAKPSEEGAMPEKPAETTVEATKPEENKTKEDSTNKIAEAKSEAIASEVPADTPPVLPVSEQVPPAAESEGEQESDNQPQAEKDDSVLSAISNTVGEAVGDAVDTVKAAATVLTAKVDGALGNLLEEEE